MNHDNDCRCFDCVKEVVKFTFPNGAVGYYEMVVFRTDLGDSYMTKKMYEGPVLMVA